MSKTKTLIYCSLFTALIAAGAFIKIPVPVVPFTLQYLFTMLAGLLLGSKRGTISVVAYMLLGLAGLPIFSEGGGLWYVFKPSFGYIIGFCLGTYVTGRIAEHLKKKTIFRYLLANLAGLMIVYACGMIYYYVICNYVINTPIGIWPQREQPEHEPCSECGIALMPSAAVLKYLASESEKAEKYHIAYTTRAYRFAERCVGEEHHERRKQQSRTCKYSRALHKAAALPPEPERREGKRNAEGKTEDAVILHRHREKRAHSASDTTDDNAVVKGGHETAAEIAHPALGKNR